MDESRHWQFPLPDDEEVHFGERFEKSGTRVAPQPRSSHDHREVRVFLPDAANAVEAGCELAKANGKASKTVTFPVGAVDEILGNIPQGGDDLSEINAFELTSP